MALVAPTITLHGLIAPGGLATAVGRLTGMVGTYLLLVTVLLVGRIPAVERAVGQDRLVVWHRRLGPWVIGLLATHALFITLGYAQGVRTGLAHELAAIAELRRAYGDEALVAALERALAFRCYGAAEVRSILVAGVQPVMDWTRSLLVAEPER